MITLASVRDALARHEARQHEEPGAARAAVAVLLAPAAAGLEVLCIRRAVRADDPWSGQVGLPGGRANQGDPDLLATAVRETREEVAIDLTPPTSELLGTLDDIYPRTPVLPPIVVRPFVFALGHQPSVTPSPELQSAFWVRLARLLEPGARRDVTLEVRDLMRTFPAYVLGPDVIWGMTERILTSLLTAASAQR
jgi:8-oxo-dGTP pyrophosphatase MutT (NUDIX family)